LRINLFIGNIILFSRFQSLDRKYHVNIAHYFSRRIWPNHNRVDPTTLASHRNVGVNRCCRCFLYSSVNDLQQATKTKTVDDDEDNDNDNNNRMCISW